MGWPLKGTTMSFRGPPEAWVTGIAPAAWMIRSALPAEVQSGAGTYHELDDVDAEMLVYHRAQPDACAGEPLEHL